MMHINIGIVDANPLTKNELSKLLKCSPDFNVMFAADSASSLLVQLKACPVDIIIMDVKLPDKDCGKLVAEIQRHNNKPNVIVLSAYDDAINVMRMIAHGVKSFISKKNLTDLDQAVRTVYNDNYFFPSSIGQIITRFVANNSTCDYATIEPITSFEILLLKLLSDGLSSREIAECIHKSPRTVEDYRTQLYEKLHVRNKEQLLIKASRLNLL